MAKLLTAIINTGDTKIGNNGYIKWRNITNQNRAILNAKKFYPASLFISIYDKNTKELITTINFYK